MDVVWFRVICGALAVALLAVIVYRRRRRAQQE